nr:immunoglobulin light chain junction region [Macaca mulatta]
CSAWDNSLSNWVF